MARYWLMYRLNAQGAIVASRIVDDAERMALSEDWITVCEWME
jgi:hypothetical protein